MTAQADTEKVYSAQKKFIWPVACVIALVLGFFVGGWYKAGVCSEAFIPINGHWSSVQQLAGDSISLSEYEHRVAQAYHDFDEAAAKCR